MRGGPGPRQQCAPSGHRCGDQEEVVDRCDEHLRLSLLLDSVEAHPVQASRRAEVWGGGARWQQYFLTQPCGAPPTDLRRVLSQIFHEMITPHLGTTTQIEYGSYLALIGDET